MKKYLLLILTVLTSCTTDIPEWALEDQSTSEDEIPVILDYSLTSHDYRQLLQPIVDFGNIVEELGLNYNTKLHTNTSLAIADFNEDSYPDLYFYTNFDGDESKVTPSFFIYDPFTKKYVLDSSILSFQEFEPYHSRKTIVGDFNLDGKPDVIRAAGAHIVPGVSNITLSTKDGYEFKGLHNIPTSTYHTLSSGDIDNDGDLDVFFGGTYDDGFAINNGDGTFEWVRSYDIIKDFKVPNSVDGDHGMYGVWTSEIVDVNNDGWDDLVLSGIYDKDEIHLNGITIIYNQSGNFDYNKREVILVDDSIIITTDTAIVDFNNDGLKDLVTLSGTSYDNMVVEAYVRNSSLNMFNKVEVDTPYSSVSNRVWITVRDLDNNGRFEITEQESSLYEVSQTIRDAITWEWDGKKFSK